MHVKVLTSVGDLMPVQRFNFVVSVDLKPSVTRVVKGINPRICNRVNGKRSHRVDS
jgi:hypothetical protein